MENFTNWVELLTLPGVTALTLLIVQFIKAPIDRVGHIPTRLIVYAVALVLMLLATVFTDGLTVERATFCVVNAVIAANAAMGAYEQTPLDKKTGGD